MREFKSGGIRDDDHDKIDYEGFLNPKVIEAFGKYMHKHRFQADGKMRDSDNWQNCFGDDHYSVCMKSLMRHVHDLWMEHRGYDSREGIEDAINGILFNAMAYYHKLLQDKEFESLDKQLDELGEEFEKEYGCACQEGDVMVCDNCLDKIIEEAEKEAEKNYYCNVDNFVNDSRNDNKSFAGHCKCPRCNSVSQKAMASCPICY